LQFRNQTLDNGLQVIAECNDQAHSASYGFFVRTGARDESDAISGVSHFLEHMVFKGTPRRTAEDVNREFDEMGAHYNAFTSDENTVYYAAVLPECQPRCVELLADIMRPSLRSGDFETEKQVIIEEILMYEDQPPFGADDKCKAAYFGAHPLARSVLGTADSVGDLTPEQMREYFERRYSPGNLVLAAAGRVDFAALVKQAAALCGEWRAQDAPRLTPAVEGRTGFHVLHQPTATQQYVMQLMSGPTAEDDARFAAKLLGAMVGDDSGSRFYWEMIDPGLAEHASLSHYEYDGAGVYMSYMSCEPDRAAENLQRMHDVYLDIEQNGFTAQELQQAKSKLNSRVVLGSERPRNRLFHVGGNWLHRGEYRAVRDDLDIVDSLTLDDIHAVLAQHPLSKSTTMTVGPLGSLKEPE
jgi:predicted Zn-dependent peptidase